MRYRLSDLPALLSTPLGRMQFKVGLYHAAWPLLSRAASVYRRTLLTNTRIIAVVGSYGKSTTARAIAKVLTRDSERVNKRNSFSFLARALLNLSSAEKYGVLEVGINKPGQMSVYSSMIRPDIVVVTSIGSEHGRSLKTLEETRQEKAAMVRNLSPGGVAVLNGDDPNVLWMKGETDARVLTYGLGNANDIRASALKLDWPRGMSFILHAEGVSHQVRTRLFGAHYVFPVLAAVAVALSQGGGIKDAIGSIEGLTPTTGRMQPVLLESGAYLLRDDFKSSYETVEVALEAFAKVPAKRRFLVIGDISEPPGKQGPLYKEIGMRLASIADRVIVIGARKSFERYCVGMAPGKRRKEVFVSAGKSIGKAVDILRDDLGPGDVVLIKGRDTQRLERVALLLSGLPVGCDITFCDAVGTRCEGCPMLERGWGKRRVMI